MMKRRKRYLALSLVIVAVAAAALLGWGYVQPAGATPGKTCNPDTGHGTPGCHVTVTTSPPAPVTTSPPAPVTTRPPAPATTKPPASATTKPALPKTTPTSLSAAGAGAAATTIVGSTTTIAGSTTTILDSSTTILDSSTSSLEPTTTVEGATTTSTDSIAALAGTGGGGGGLTGGWIAFMSLLGVFALIGWAGMAIQWSGNRRTSANGGATVSGPVRFVLAERLAHWVYAFCFLVAGLSGALMWIPSTRTWMAGARYTVSQYHGYVGLAMVLVPLLIFLVLDRRRLAETRRAVDEWDANDGRWLRAALSGRMLRGGKMPPQGRFNAGQKVNSHLVAGLALGFVVTGILLLFRFHLPLWLLPGLLLGHKVLAVTSAMLLFGHLGIALLTRHGRGGLRAMVKGRLPREIAREGHATWYAEWLKQKRGEDDRSFVADA